MNWRSEMWQITEELSGQQILDLNALYQRQWWTKGRTMAETQSCVEQSSICWGVYNSQGRLQGFARVLTDFVFKALIFDLIVDESVQGAGIGTQLLSAILGHHALSEVKHIELYCLPELEPYYAAFGFSADVGDVRLMRLTR